VRNLIGRSWRTRTAACVGALYTLVVMLAACSPGTANTAPSGLVVSQTAASPTAEAYRDQLRRACRTADEKMQQIQVLYPKGVPIDAQLDVERGKFVLIGSATPPDEFAAAQANIATAYRQRIAKLEALGESIAAGNKDKTELQSLRDAADGFADQLNGYFEAVGVKECQF
jgi:hypothetical protein